MGIETRIFLTFATLRNNHQPIVKDFNGNTYCVTNHILASKLLFNCYV